VEQHVNPYELKVRGIRLDLGQVVYIMRAWLNRKGRVLLPGLHRIRQDGSGEEFLCRYGRYKIKFDSF